MISFDASQTESRSGFLETAGLSALLLTHRRGGAVLVFDPVELRRRGVEKEASLPTELCDAMEHALGFAFQKEPFARLLVSELIALRCEVAPGGFAPYFLGGGKGFALALSFTTTAEHLTDMYLAALGYLEQSDEDVRDLVCGIGPGSFTGLRIGCAFANGLQAGRRRRLWGIPCHGLTLLRDLGAASRLSGEWFQDFSVLDAGRDESFARVGFLDAIMSIAELVGPNCEGADVLTPRYGKDPGPVIKLRERCAQEPQ